MADPAPAPVVALTPEEQADALALYAYLLALRRSGNRIAVVHLDDEIGARPTGKRVNPKGLTRCDNMTVKVQAI